VAEREAKDGDGTFPTDVELTRLLVVSDVNRSRTWYTDGLGATVSASTGARRACLSCSAASAKTPPVDNGYEARAFFRDPDGHLFEISSVAG
jgi:catechol 2,3-dioxygenase-like lactoylglutathione lyase family enzyme